MNVIISNADARPIYEQIYAQIKGCILSGELSEGDLLPSIRALAKDLRISVITTKRAYEELEKGGYINTVAGKGCYVARKNVQLIREEYLTRMEEHLRQVVRLSRECGVSQAEAAEMLRLLYEEE